MASVQLATPILANIYEASSTFSASAHGNNTCLAQH